MRAIRTALTISLCALAAVARAQEPTELRAIHADTPPRIDGDLSDVVWQTPPLQLAEWISYNPVRGDSGSDRTEVRVAYDDRNIYFAFHCIDRDPSRVRATLSRRDDAFNDDWVGVSLDSTGSGQSAYHLFINPRGVQMDAVNTVSAGERFDTDLVWRSGARQTDDGYAVEVAVPLETIRFTGGRDVRMGILFFRHFSQSGYSYSWPSMPPGQWVFERHAHITFDNLAERRLIELIPSAVLPVTQLRDTASSWQDADAKPDAGISAKLGITSSITLDGTINPDFSQVESDAFQVLTNQRFPVFFSEKRPFFMEGLGLMNLAATGGDSNMRRAVHTRTIVNPSWGAKVTGTAGGLSFGALNSSDDTPIDMGDRGVLVSGRDKFFSVGRATYALGTGNYAGGLFTDTEHAGRRNQTESADLSVKLTPRQQVNGNYIHTTTTDEVNDRAGDASTVSYSYESRRYSLNALTERYDRDFQMDTAFYNRTGFNASFVSGDVSFYPDSLKRRGVIRLRPFLFGKYGQDHVQDGPEEKLIAGIKLDTTRQGYFEVNVSLGNEPWLGQRYRNDQFFAIGIAQVSSTVHLFGAFHVGQSVFYDPVAPYQGREHGGSESITLQPNQHITQEIAHDWVLFDHADTGARAFTVHVVNSKSVYQFNRQFLIRLLEQWDSSRHTLLSDLLASYEVVPGTVFYAGYGSLYARGTFDAGEFNPGAGTSQTVSRGLFFKASYLHRF